MTPKRGFFSKLGIFRKPPLSDREIAKGLSDDAIMVENAARRGEAVSVQVENSAYSYLLATNENYKLALAAAKAAEDPNRNPLLDIYENMLKDAHLASIIESRILPLKAARFRFVNESGDPDLEAPALLRRQWFEKYIEIFMWAKFMGVSVVELFEISEEMELTRATLISRKNTLAYKGLIVKREGDEKGWNYKEGALEPYYIQIGEDRDVGLLAEIAPITIFKKFAMGNWSEFIEKFGIPPRYVVTRSKDEKRLKQLSDMMKRMFRSGYVVLQKDLDEEIHLLSVPGVDAYKVFDQMIIRCNSEMSKRILGQDGTTDHGDAKGTYGSLKILMDVAQDRHISDRNSFEYHVNEVLIPKLVGISPFYKPLENLIFQWDDGADLEVRELLEAIKNLPYEVDTDYLSEKTGIVFTGNKISQGPAPTSGEGEEEKK